MCPLITWVDYLVEEGLNPDDFAGHLARNANHFREPESEMR